MAVTCSAREKEKTVILSGQCSSQNSNTVAGQIVNAVAENCNQEIEINYKG